MCITSAHLAYIDPGSGFTILGLGGVMIAFLAGFLAFFSIFARKILNFLKRNVKKTIVLLAIILSIAIIWVVFMGEKKSSFDKKIVVLGFDGLSPVIVERLIGRGELPNFSKLKEKGSYSHLSTTNPSQSPVAWTGFATGQNPGKNGIFDFIKRDPATYKLDLALSDTEKGKPKRVVKSKCFWHYTTEENIPTVIITCPVTLPPDRVKGRMLSGMGVPDILGTEGTFTFYTTEFLDKAKDIGGRVFHVERSREMHLNLIGPRFSASGGKAENVKVPFKAKIIEGRNRIAIEYEKEHFELKVGEWSDWKEVSFKLGLTGKAFGILKFYLVEVEPEFKLYITPINLDPRKPLFPISYPAGYSGELAENLGLYYTQGMPMDTWAVNEKRLTEKPFLTQVDEVLAEKVSILTYEMKRFKKGVLFCYFESSDIIQHMFWRYTDPEHPLYEEGAPERYKGLIEGWYKKMDGILGGVMASLEEEDVIIVMSDHGFDTFRRSAHINSWLMSNGYLALKDANATSGRELLIDVDWSGTKAYAIGFGAIYINQKGRERDGIVNPGAETESLKNEISGKMKAWTDVKYGKPVANRVYSREEIFWGPYERDGPDLYVGFNIGYRTSWQTALGAVPGVLIEDNLKKWSGSHLFDPNLIPGIILSNRKIEKENPSILDIAPTILYSVGFSREDLEKLDLDGSPLFDRK